MIWISLCAFMLVLVSVGCEQITTAGNDMETDIQKDLMPESSIVDAELNYKLGNKHIENGEFDKAIPYFNKAIELNPRHAEAYRHRAYSFSQKGEYDKAIEDLGKAIELNPDCAEEYGNRGIVYFQKGEYEKAFADFTKDIDLNPKFL